MIELSRERWLHINDDYVYALCISVVSSQSNPRVHVLDASYQNNVVCEFFLLKKRVFDK